MAEGSLLDKGAILEKNVPSVSTQKCKTPIGIFSRQGEKLLSPERRKFALARTQAFQVFSVGPRTFPEACLDLPKRTPPYKGLPKISDPQALVAQRGAPWGRAVPSKWLPSDHQVGTAVTNKLLLSRVSGVCIPNRIRNICRTWNQKHAEVMASRQVISTCKMNHWDRSFMKH